MNIMLPTIAELVRAAGFAPPVASEASARDVELALEAAFLDHGLTRYEHSREVADESDPFVFTLRDAADAEQILWGSKAVEELPKMCLARRLELLRGRDGLQHKIINIE